MLKAIIFDRDGTLNRTTQILRPGQKDGDATDGYVLAPAELELFPAVRPALSLLKKNGIDAFVFTQQNCVCKGLVTEQQIKNIHSHMNALLAPDAAIKGFYVAWNNAGEKNNPRAKPNPAMIFEILEEHALGKNDVLVAGDSKRDYEAAMAAGTAFAWVKDDLGRVSMEDMQKTGCLVFNDVLELSQHYTAQQSPS